MTVEELLSEIVDIPEDQRGYEVVILDRQSGESYSIDPSDVRYEHEDKQVVLHTSD